MLPMFAKNDEDLAHEWLLDLRFFVRRMQFRWDFEVQGPSRTQMFSGASAFSF